MLIEVILILILDLGGRSEVILPLECYVPSSDWGSMLTLVMLYAH